MNFQNIPPELTSLPHWVCYKTFGDKPKVPFNPVTGKPADTTDPSTWVDFQTASKLFINGGYEGIGFVFSKDDPFIGIDLDKCVDPQTNKVEPWAAPIIAEFNSYTELSPSGTGAHIIIKGQLPPGINGRKRGNIEVYGSQRYFTITGHRFTVIPSTIENRQKELDSFYNKHFGGDSQTTTPSNEPAWWKTGPVDPTELLPVDQELFKRAVSAKNGDSFKLLLEGDYSGYNSQSEADMALVSHLAFWCGNDPKRIDRLFRSSELYREKWDRVGWNTICKILDSRQDHAKEVFTPLLAQNAVRNPFDVSNLELLSAKQLGTSLLDSLKFFMVKPLLVA